MFNEKGQVIAIVSHIISHSGGNEGLGFAVTSNMSKKLLLEEGVKRGLKASREYSVSVLGYDFVGLISRLAIFFITGFLINSYFQATIQGGIWLNSLAGFFGLNFPTTLPEWTTKLFTTK